MLSTPCHRNSGRQVGRVADASERTPPHASANRSFTISYQTRCASQCEAIIQMSFQTHDVEDTNDLADAALSTPYREPVRLLEHREFQRYFLCRLSFSSRWFSSSSLAPHDRGGSVAEWLACWTQAQKGPGSNRSRDAVG